MPKRDLLFTMDQRLTVRNGELSSGATVVQVGQLALGQSITGDLQITNQGRLIVGEHPDIEQRIVISQNGLFGYNDDGTNTFAVYTRDTGDNTAGDVFAGIVDGNYLLYDQSEGTLGLYSEAGAGFIASGDGSLWAGDTEGAHMHWSSERKAFEVRNGEDVRISLDANGDGFFDGTVYAQGGRIYGDMWVDGLLRIGDVDGPQITIGKFARTSGNDLIETGEIIASDANNLPWFHVTAGGETAGGGWFHLGGTGEYDQRLTYDGTTLLVSGTVYADAFVLSGSGSIEAGGTLQNAGKFIAGTDENVAIIDGLNTNWRIYAGSATPDLAPFRVNQAGEVWLDNAHIVGTIEVELGGEIGGWTIAADYLVKDTGIASTSAGLAPLDYPFYSGATYTGRAAAPFRVTSSGELFATDANISGSIIVSGGYVSGVLYVGDGDPRILIDGNNKQIESTNFVSNVSGFRIEGTSGNAEFNNIRARGAIEVAVFNKSLITAFAGSNMVSKSASRLYSDLTVGSSMSLIVDKQAGGAPFANNDIVRIKDGTLDVWATVDTGTDGTLYWIYTATRQSGSSSGTIRAGNVAVDYGQSGDGYVMLSADGTNKPWVSIVTHAGAPWTTLTERARLGNLTGISGASGYGLWTDNGFFTGTVNAGNGAILIDSAGITATVSTASGGAAESSYKFKSGSTETSYWRVYNYSTFITSYLRHTGVGLDRNAATNINTITDGTGFSANTNISSTYSTNQPTIGLQAATATSAINMRAATLTVDGNSGLSKDVTATIYGWTTVNQANNAAAVPVLTLTQADVSEEMIEFTSTAGTGYAIEAVGSKTLTTTAFIKVTVNGDTRYIPVGTIA